eukprot:CAMPEP_0114493522 /NCGR_PEP_ID=MMETSP0109-20121206/4154_1 /TAXON_ID=29199 /ORGANISM="Chlorarachnion reptans, Strain CCCM449" /LENGTH=59 /DNA_ID=CAMNT_0001670479 /DNA_START=1356 /DNA_END=1531 /DNA_ORIENTATION=-
MTVTAKQRRAAKPPRPRASMPPGIPTPPRSARISSEALQAPLPPPGGRRRNYVVRAGIG